MPRPWWSVAALAATFLAAGCGAAAPPAVSSGKPQQKPPTGAPANLAPAALRLHAGLTGVSDPGSVLDALSPQARSELDTLIGRLSDAERTELAGDAGPLAGERPVLHLVSGGASDAALLSIAATSRGADDLVLARRAAGKADMADLVAVARELARRAGARWLRSRAADLGSKAFTPELCDAIDRVAASLGRVDLQRSAREAGVELDASAARHLAVARAAAFDLDGKAARRSLSAAAAAKPPGDGQVVAETEALVVLAERAKNDVAAKDVEASVERARALLRLQRPKDAARLLEPLSARARTHLGLAATSALASVEGSICPGLPAAIGNVTLCAAAWSTDPRVKSATELTNGAWKAGEGRDPTAVETHLGIAFVVPWIYAALAGGGAGAPAAFAERLEGMRQATRGASKISPRFEGLALFVDGLSVGFEAAAKREPGKAIQIPDAAQEELVRRAEKLGRSSASERYTQSGVLAVAALLAQERDVLPLVELLPEQLRVQDRLARAALRTWASAARGRPEIAEKARSELTALMPDAARLGIDRAELVLLIAEGDAALAGDERAYAVLAQVARQLTGDGVPAALRLRAALDAAGSLARHGKHTEAIGLLEKAASLPIAGGASTESDLATLARGYLIVLHARDARAAEREEYRSKLTGLFEGDSQNAPASIRLWRDLWQKDLEYRAAEERCGALKVCLARAEAVRAVPETAIRARVGAEAAELVKRGTLAAGTLRLSFNFSAEAGLEPIVALEPRLLAVEFPARSRPPARANGAPASGPEKRGPASGPRDKLPK
jgi:hypothetical protein